MRDDERQTKTSQSQTSLLINTQIYSICNVAGYTPLLDSRWQQSLISHIKLNLDFELQCHSHF